MMTYGMPCIAILISAISTFLSIFVSFISSLLFSLRLVYAELDFLLVGVGGSHIGLHIFHHLPYLLNILPLVPTIELSYFS